MTVIPGSPGKGGQEGAGGQAVTLGVGSTGRGEPPWGASHEDLMEERGTGISKGLAPSHAEGLLAGSFAWLTSAQQHASFR